MGNNNSTSSNSDYIITYFNKRKDYWYFTYHTKIDYKSRYSFYTDVKFKNNIKVLINPAYNKNNIINYTISCKYKYNIIIDSFTNNFVVLSENNIVIYIVINNDNEYSGLYSDEDGIETYLNRYKMYDIVEQFKKIKHETK